MSMMKTKRIRLSLSLSLSTTALVRPEAWHESALASSTGEP